MPPLRAIRSWDFRVWNKRAARNGSRGAASALAILALAALAGCVAPPEETVAPTPNIVQTAPQPTPQPAPQPAPPPQASPTPPPAEPTPPVAVQPAPPPMPAKVALLLPLSGSSAPIGQALLNAAQLAVFDFPGAQLTLLPKDTRGTSDGAAQAARQALAEGAELVLGPLFSKDVRATGPIVASAGLNEIAFSTDRQVAGANVFLIGFLPEENVSRVVSFAARQGSRRIAALVPGTDYGQRISAGLRTALAASGAKAGPVQTYQAGDVQDMSNALKALTGRDAAPGGNPDGEPTDAADRADKAAPSDQKPLGFDTLLIAAGGPPLHALAPLLPSYGIAPGKVRLLGTGLWDGPQVRNEPTLTGGWFAGPPPDGFLRFSKRYQDTFGAEPPRIASLAYDATALAAVLAKSGAPGQRFSGPALTDPRGFAGVDGIFRLLPTGLAERGLAVLEVRPDAFAIVDPAPAAFGTVPGQVSTAAPDGSASGQDFAQDRVEQQPAARGGAQAPVVQGDQPVLGQPVQHAVAAR